MTPEEFYDRLAKQEFDLSDTQKKQFERYFELLVEWNQKINLTAITDKEGVYLKHFYDSIAPVLQGKITNQEIRLLDIGAGAGFPSIPIKILCPDIDVTIIDSLNKRINFLNLLAEELGLDGVHFYHGRAEDYGQDKAFRASYDIVTARAVARLQVLTELTIPFLNVGGQLILKHLLLKKNWLTLKMPCLYSFQNLLKTIITSCQTVTVVKSQFLKRKKKHQINTHVKLACQIKNLFNGLIVTISGSSSHLIAIRKGCSFD